MMVELIDDFFAEYHAAGGSDKVDTDEADELIDAIAKTVAELTSQQDGVCKIMHYDEFRTEDSRLWREALTAIRIEKGVALGGADRRRAVRVRGGTHQARQPTNVNFSE